VDDGAGANWCFVLKSWGKFTKSKKQGQNYNFDIKQGYKRKNP